MRSPWHIGAAVAIVVVAVARVVATYDVFSHTVDEPPHIAAGLEWLERGQYTFEVQHPPLARIAVAIGPYLAGTRLQDLGSMREEGVAALYDRGAYRANLARARLGTLPFLILSCIAVWAWSTRLFGATAGVWSLLVYSLVPPVLAHAGLATTDMALSGSLLAALALAAAWSDRPSYGLALLVGAATGIAVLSKFTALVFVPLGIAAIVAMSPLVMSRRAADPRQPWGRVALQALAGGGCALLVVWAGYRFSAFYPSSLGGLVPWPAPELVDGVRAVASHNAEGHPTYLLGERGMTGWPHFFLVALAVKTPIALFVLAGLGATAAARATRGSPDRRWVAPVLAAALILLSVLPARINLGVRHVLPIYALLSVVAGVGVTGVWSSARVRHGGRAAVVALLLWLGYGSATAHPDYLTYFNALAGSRPDRVLNGSDFDWGQDFNRLVDSAKSRGLDSVWVAVRHPTEDVRKQGLPDMRRLPPDSMVTGWVAVPDFHAKSILHDGFTWTNAFTPVLQVGKTIRVYHITSQDLARRGTEPGSRPLDDAAPP